LTQAGCEIGVHGIDSWHSVEKARSERDRFATCGSSFRSGIRMHWLLQDTNTPSVLEEAGYLYDSTSGYNETVGFRSGTTQVFRPQGCQRLLELPMHIQDGALFFGDRLNMTEDDAWTRCTALLSHAQMFGGVLTVLWHDRSHAPERLWGDFYERMVMTLKSSGAWFGTASQVVEWFHQRRAVRFDSDAELKALGDGQAAVNPSLTVRFHIPAVRDGHWHAPATFVDVAWDGKTPLPLTPCGVALRAAVAAAQAGKAS
jgi:hypothetical protein